MSADVCPVCGAAKSPHREGFTCGGESGFSDCEHAERLAIERAAEIARLKAALQRIADQDATTWDRDWKHWKSIARETLEDK